MIALLPASIHPPTKYAPDFHILVREDGLILADDLTAGGVYPAWTTYPREACFHGSRELAEGFLANLKADFPNLPAHRLVRVRRCFSKHEDTWWLAKEVTSTLLRKWGWMRGRRWQKGIESFPGYMAPKERVQC